MPGHVEDIRIEVAEAQQGCGTQECADKLAMTLASLRSHRVVLHTMATRLELAAVGCPEASRTTITDIVNDLRLM